MFIATFVTGIAARFLFVDGLGATWQDMRFIPGAGSDTPMKVGAIFEFLLIIANIGTAVVLYPIVKRQSEKLALGYVTARIVESTFILVGLLSLVAALTVRQDLAGTSGAEAASLIATGKSLVSTYEWAFLFGPGLVVGFGNGLMLGYLMYRSGLVPRGMAMLGLIGGPMLIVSFGLIFFGVYENGSAPSALMVLPEIAWEASLGIYAAWKGFRRVPITADGSSVASGNGGKPALSAASA
ncbi:MAG: DUF4386 domain-containing protein [Actinomycetota bacterium]